MLFTFLNPLSTEMKAVIKPLFFKNPNVEKNKEKMVIVHLSFVTEIKYGKNQTLLSGEKLINVSL